MTTTEQRMGDTLKKMSKIKPSHVWHAIRYEPKRIWWWWHQKDLLTGKRFGLKDAIRATIENPPSFDMMWNYKEETPLQTKARMVAEKRAQERELQVTKWIAEHGFVKKFFNRWLFIFCDMKGFKFDEKE